MPLFCYRCKKCKGTFDEFFHNRNEGETAPCPKCGTVCKKVLHPHKYKVTTGQFFEPYMETDLGPEPVLIKSPDHFKQECAKRGLGWRKMPGRLK